MLMKRIALALAFLGIFASISFAQSTRTTRPRVVPTPTPTIVEPQEEPSVRADGPPVLVGGQRRPTATPTPADGEDEVIRVETNLVTMPVSVLDRDGRFISGLGQRDFQIFENGKQQKIEYFQSTEQPFTVALMIDVSPSTAFRMDEIHNAAISFVNQLRPNDRVMVVAFDDKTRILSQPTNNRAVLHNAIRRAQFGDGTSLYESVESVIKQQLGRESGRKAIVLFTDGVDTTSRRASYQSSLTEAEETDVLVYPIRYNTYSQYANQNGTWGGGRGGRQTGWGGVIGIILSGQGPVIRRGPGPAGSSRQEYETGDRYLEKLARNSGGRKFEADSTQNLDAAFSGIAEELRRQYSVGYYPDDVGQIGDRKQIRIRVNRPNAVVRAKTSYIVGQSEQRFAGR